MVQRQSFKLKVLRSIPSGGYYFVAGFVVRRLLVVQFCVWRGLLRSSALLNIGIWRNGSASDSISKGWEFESFCPRCLLWYLAVFLGGGCAHVLTRSLGVRASEVRAVAKKPPVGSNPRPPAY